MNNKILLTTIVSVIGKNKSQFGNRIASFFLCNSYNSE